VDKLLIFIRPGHGGADPGAVGPNKLREADQALALAKLLADKLADHKTMLARTWDVTLGLDTGVAMAEKAKADLFVSLHFNAAKDIYAHGTETLYHPASEKGKHLAECIQYSLSYALRLANRGIKPRPNLYELRVTSMPAVIVETAFISNPGEEKLIADPAWLDKAADAIAAGITEYGQGLMV
jgi:N-acetylmuramoyl-L-alanine amidase